MAAAFQSVLDVVCSKPTAAWNQVRELESWLPRSPWKVVAACAVVGLVGSAVSLYVVYRTNPKALLIARNRLNRRRCGFKSKKVSAVDGFTFCYAERGRRKTRQEGRPPVPTVVMVPGLGGTVENWVPVVMHMSTNVHIVAVDMPGSGTTSCFPEGDYNLLGQAERLKQFLGLIKLDDSPVHLVGAATGGTVVGCFAAIYPQLVAKLTLVCPAMRSPIDSDLIKIKKSGIDPGLVPTSPNGIPVVFQLLSRKPKDIPKQIRKGIFDIMKPSLEHRTKLADKMFSDIWLNEKDILLTQRLGDIKAPTLVIWGQYDRVIHVSGADVLREKLPNCVGIEILPNAGHSIFMDDPNKLAQLLQDFVDNKIH